MSDSASSADKIFLSILSTTGLWNLVREKGGAYGVGAYLDYIERIWSFYSYRDPRLDGTIKDLRKAVEDFSADDERLSDALIAELSRTLRPVAPAIRSLIDIRRIVYGISDDERERKLDEILSLSVSDIMQARDRFLCSLQLLHVAAIGDRNAVEKSSFPFTSRSLPLSSVVQSGDEEAE